MTLAARALAQLATWPDLTEAVPSCGSGQALSSAGGEIAHFHSGRDVDLHLTARAIRRLEGDLRRFAAVRVVPGSSWVTLRLDASADVDLLMSLMSVALKAHQGPPDDGRAIPCGCNDVRGVGFVRI
ncbi:luciferase family protein [Streptomyces sp. HYC2]|uniref:luciferase domain-containing protein n=1 Tax=Streptomyces sp. HYC2 TaxID=2955207 RepID=UPI0024817CCD|nr:luciferase family protein [Streptomyces sp. HYC2]